MYSYEEFKEKFKEKLLEMASDEEKKQVRFGSITKISGEADTVGLCGDLGGYQGGPCIYLKEVYERYMMGSTLDNEAAVVWNTFKKAGELGFTIPTLDWEYVKDKVAFQLINLEKNADFLKGVPYRAYLDLAVIYRVILDIGPSGITSCVVTKGLMEHMGVSEEELYEAAYRMTPVLLAPRVYTMYEMLCEMKKRGKDEKGPEVDEMLAAALDSHMWVASNNIKQFGAYILLYPCYFESLSEENKDYYIIPSSVHELIILPTDIGEGVSDLEEMIRYVNENELSAEECLSDTLYRYDSVQKTIIKAADK